MLYQHLAASHLPFVLMQFVAAHASTQHLPVFYATDISVCIRTLAARTNERANARTNERTEPKPNQNRTKTEPKSNQPNQHNQAEESRDLARRERSARRKDSFTEPVVLGHVGGHWCASDPAR